MRNKSIISILAICSLAWSMSACTDVWEEHYQAEKPITGDVVMTDNNLWEQIVADATLTEFAQLLTVTGYDSLLMSDRIYTVWAPKNGSGFLSEDVKAKLQNPTKEDIALWKREIVENHISNVSIQANGVREKVKDNNIEMLNEKAYYLLGNVTGGYTIQDKPFLSTNLLTKNGVLHKVDGCLEFLPTIWEQLAKESGISKLWAFLAKDYKLVFDPGLSIEGPIVNEEQTWLDSVFKEECRWFHEIGYLDRADSSYTMYALTDRAWDEMTATARAYYQYDKPFDSGQDQDEAIDSLAHELICRHLVFSNTINKDFFNGNQVGGEDCVELKSNHWRDRLIFKGEEATSLSKGQVGDARELYNGKLIIVDSVNYNPFTCWHDTIRVEGESLSNADEKKKEFESANKDNSGRGQIHRDSILYYSVSNHAVGIYKAHSGVNINPVFTFRINNALSAWYRIKIVLLPPQLLNPVDTAFVKPNKFKASLWHNDKVINDFKNHISNSSRIDTITLAEAVKIPACEYDLKNLCKTDPTLQLKIISDIDFGTAKNPKEGSKGDKSDWLYDNDFRIDQVIFEPIEEPAGTLVTE